jgi:hypothetical protein
MKAKPEKMAEKNCLFRRRVARPNLPILEEKSHKNTKVKPRQQ